MSEEISSIGVKLSLNASNFMAGMTAATEKTDAFVAAARQASTVAGEAGATKRGSGPSAAQNISGVNVDLTISSAQIKKLRTQIIEGLGAIPIRITPQITKAVQGEAEKVVAAQITPAVGTRSGAAHEVRTAVKQNLPQRAYGGPVQQGRSYVVGERRAEVFTPRQTGYVHADAERFYREQERLEQQHQARMRRMAGGPTPARFGLRSVTRSYPNASVDLSQSSRRDRLRIGDELVDLAREYPHTARSMKTIQSVPDRQMNAAVARAYSTKVTSADKNTTFGLTTGGNARAPRMLINSSFRDEDVRSIGAYPRNVVEGVIHEFGHAVDFSNGIMGNEILGRGVNRLASVSPYGNRGREHFAELFTAHRRGALSKTDAGIFESIKLIDRAKVARARGGRVRPSQSLEARALRIFGETDEISEAGFLTPSGRLLDFSGRHYATGYRRNASNRNVPTGRRGDDYLAFERNVDHHEVANEGLVRRPRDANAAVQRMLNRGFVRLFSTNAGVDPQFMAEMSRPANDAQIARLVREYSGTRPDVLIDVANRFGQSKGVVGRTDDDSPFPMSVGSALRQANEIARRRRMAGGPAHKGHLDLGPIEPNLRKFFAGATPQQRTEGADWYAKWGAELRKEAGSLNLDPKLLTSVAAALSPNNGWPGNFHDAIKYARAWSQGMPMPQASTFGTNQKKAWSILQHQSGDFLKGQKVQPFGAALLGDPNAKPQDIWMKRAAVGDLSLSRTKGTPSVRQRREMDRVIDQIAAENKLEPRQVQAIIWTAAREQGMAAAGTAKHHRLRSMGGAVSTFREVMPFIAQGHMGGGSWYDAVTSQAPFIIQKYAAEHMGRHARRGDIVGKPRVGMDFAGPPIMPLPRQMADMFQYELGPEGRSGKLFDYMMSGQGPSGLDWLVHQNLPRDPKPHHRGGPVHAFTGTWLKVNQPIKGGETKLRTTTPKGGTPQLRYDSIAGRRKVSLDDALKAIEEHNRTAGDGPAVTYMHGKAPESLVAAADLPSGLDDLGNLVDVAAHSDKLKAESRERIAARKAKMAHANMEARIASPEVSSTVERVRADMAARDAAYKAELEAAPGLAAAIPGKSTEEIASAWWGDAEPWYRLDQYGRYGEKAGQLADEREKAGKPRSALGYRHLKGRLAKSWAAEYEAGARPQFVISEDGGSPRVFRAYDWDDQARTVTHASWSEELFRPHTVPVEKVLPATRTLIDMYEADAQAYKGANWYDADVRRLISEARAAIGVGKAPGPRRRNKVALDDKGRRIVVGPSGKETSISGTFLDASEARGWRSEGMDARSQENSIREMIAANGDPRILQVAHDRAEARKGYQPGVGRQYAKNLSRHEIAQYLWDTRHQLRQGVPTLRAGADAPIGTGMPAMVATARIAERKPANEQAGFPPPIPGRYDQLHYADDGTLYHEWKVARAPKMAWLGDGSGSGYVVKERYGGGGDFDLVSNGHGPNKGVFATKAEAEAWVKEREAERAKRGTPVRTHTINPDYFSEEHDAALEAQRNEPGPHVPSVPRHEAPEVIAHAKIADAALERRAAREAEEQARIVAAQAEAKLADEQSPIVPARPGGYPRTAEQLVTERAERIAREQAAAARKQMEGLGLFTVSRRHRAAGGDAGEGLYIVNEEGPEAFLTKRDAAKLTALRPDIMRRIPHAADGARTGMIDKAAWGMFAPQQDGVIIPAKYAKEALHAVHAADGIITDQDRVGDGGIIRPGSFTPTGPIIPAGYQGRRLTADEEAASAAQKLSAALSKAAATIEGAATRTGHAFAAVGTELNQFQGPVQQGLGDLGRPGIGLAAGGPRPTLITDPHRIEQAGIPGPMYGPHMGYAPVRRGTSVVQPTPDIMYGGAPGEGIMFSETTARRARTAVRAAGLPTYIPAPVVEPAAAAGPTLPSGRRPGKVPAWKTPEAMANLAAYQAAKAGVPHLGERTALDPEDIQTLGYYRQQARYQRDMEGSYSPSAVLAQHRVGRSAVAATMTERTQKGVAAVYGALTLGGGAEFKKRQVEYQIAEQGFNRIDAALAKTTIDVNAYKGILDEANLSEKSRTKFTTLFNEASLKQTQQEKQRTEAVKKLDEADKAAQPGLLGAARNFGGIIAATSAYGMAMTVASKLLETGGEELGKFIDVMVGLPSTTNKATMSLAGGLVEAGGNVSAAFGKMAQSAGIGAEGLDYLRKKLETTVTVQAGQKVEAQGANLWRGAMGIGQGVPKGLYGGYGGVLDTGFLAQQLGGAAGFAETVGGNFTAANQMRMRNTNKVAAGNQMMGAAAMAGISPFISNEERYKDLNPLNPGDWPKFVGASLKGGPKNPGEFLTMLMKGPEMIRSVGEPVAPNLGNGGISHSLTGKGPAEIIRDTQNATVDEGNKAYAAHLTDLMGRTAANEGRPGSNFTVAGGNGRMDEVHTAEQTKRDEQFMQAARQTGDKKAIDAAQSMVDAGYVIQDSMGSVVGDSQTLQKAWEEMAKGATLVDPGTYAAQIAQSMRASFEQMGAMGSYQLNTAIPLQLGQQLAAQPLLPAQAGVLPTTGSANISPAMSKTVKGLIADTNKLQADLTAQGQAAVEAETKFIAEQAAVNPALDKMAASMNLFSDSTGQIASSGTPITTATGAYAGLMKTISVSGATIAKYQEDIVNAQTNASFKAYANNLRLANRALRDATGLAGQAGGSALGAMQRAQQLLSFMLSQKQINFQTAMAGFQAPGLTSEERGARQQQAQLEANVAQQQLNLSIGVFGQQVAYGLADAKAARAVMVAEHEAQVYVAAITKRIAAEQLKQSQAIAKSGVIVQGAEGTLSGILNAASTFVSQFGRSVDTATVEIYSALGYIKTKKGWVKNTTDVVGSGRNAAGYLGAFGKGAVMTVGEAGPETVAILRNPRSYGAFGGGFGGGMSSAATTVNLTINVQGDVKDEATVAKIVRAVEDSFNRKAARIGMRSYVSATG
jgi:hypothetical protein